MDSLDESIFFVAAMLFLIKKPEFNYELTFMDQGYCEIDSYKEEVILLYSQGSASFLLTLEELC